MSISKNFLYALNGITKSIKEERSIKICCVISFLVIIISFLLKINYIEWAIVLIPIGLVISLEIINSAIEDLVDLICPEIDSRAGKTKDYAAGAVLWMSIISVIIGLIIFGSKIKLLLQT